MIRLLSLYFLFMMFLIFTTHGNSVCSHGNSTSEKYKVIIVGAGISGIGAATHLLKNNFSDIAILEASNRLGGRVHTAPFGDFLIEYGAQWVHGLDDNAVYTLVLPYNFLYIQVVELKNSFVKHSDSKLNLSVINDWLFDEAVEFFYNTTDMTSCNCSVEDYFDKKFKEVIELKNIDKYTAQAVNDFFKKTQGSVYGTGNLSTVGWGNELHQYYENKDLAWKTGYHSLIDILLGKYEGKELPVIQKTKFNKVVQTINWTGNEVQLTCEDGTHYFADHVIVTVSLGVLKFSAKTMFNPPLPNNKLIAIESLGFDIVNKFYIQFETRWWPMNFAHMFNFLWTNEDKQRFKNESKYDGWATEIIGFHFVENQPRILEAWVMGDTARLLETLSDDDLIGAVMEVLNWFVGNKYTISHPINTTRSAWASNPFVRGAYSYLTVKSDHLEFSAIDVIAEPLSFNQTNPVILFAGEASHNKHFSTVHGALETGWREAMRILNF
ncbi:peroxisomal N(1)-acetyl-spermine/spermidine oxidase-like [Lycorma delicatula]|uniref:peroxisomal N(1)-acetyl-spermine/spermidine oxidase-like n=1 Tax=Lycorma delicatula TaxID=130591 RepID=UPI003F50EBC6